METSGPSVVDGPAESPGARAGNTTPLGGPHPEEHAHVIGCRHGLRPDAGKPEVEHRGAAVAGRRQGQLRRVALVLRQRAEKRIRHRPVVVEVADEGRESGGGGGGRGGGAWWGWGGWAGCRGGAAG